MTSITTHNSSAFYPVLMAIEIAQANEMDDPDSIYRVIDHGNGKASIEVLDEAGTFIGNI